MKSAFLNGVFHEEVYVDQTLGFVIEGKEDKICKLKKALYCLKQARRAWYEESKPVKLRMQKLIHIFLKSWVSQKS